MVAPDAGARRSDRVLGGPLVQRRAAKQSEAPPVPGPRGNGRVVAYDLLKDAILSGRFEPGQPLVETAVADWCGVSRTPVREAFRRLEHDGLIHRKEGLLVVRERSPEDILDVYETRIVLEATAARIAADRRTDHDVRLLRAVLEQCRRVPDDDPRMMVETNKQFHRGIWRATRNESLIEALERLSMHLGRYPERTLGYPGRWAAACDAHEELIDAIEARKAKKAHDLSERYFTEARDIRLRMYAEDNRL